MHSTLASCLSKWVQGICVFTHMSSHVEKHVLLLGHILHVYICIALYVSICEVSGKIFPCTCTYGHVDKHCCGMYLYADRHALLLMCIYVLWCLHALIWLLRVPTYLCTHVYQCVTATHLCLQTCGHAMCTHTHIYIFRHVHMCMQMCLTPASVDLAST